ncbi:hypothetical protein IJG28_02675 [Candidatus Saccharibacteria bacterium]|nr:hypothetical protein [Candidatus Saccharibacteria bacterium]
MTEGKKKMQSGGKNLILLGVISIVVAVATTGVSLAIYHNSGDIYLDRSRPGFLPDEAEIEEEEIQEENFDFAKSGSLSMEQLEEYIKMFKVEVEMIDSEENPFASGVLSDTELGIPKAEGD